MVGPSRSVILALAFGLVSPAALRADDPAPKPADGQAGRLAPADFGLPGEDPPAAFVPRTPRTVAEQRRVEATRLYVEARAQEDLRQFTAAILTLEKALESAPDSVPILRRLSLLCGATGRTDRSIEYGRRVVAAEPGDAATIARIVGYFKRRDAAKAEPFLKEVLANPKLDKGSSEALVLEFELADLYELGQRFDKAAESYKKVLDALDTKVGNRLTPADQRRILGEDEAVAYVRFAEVFRKAGRLDQAIRCVRRAEVYDEANPIYPLMLAYLLVQDNRAAEALAEVEKALKHHPKGREAYDELAKVLKKLGRDEEILPRIEAASRADPKNVDLQYALAERYREAGRVEKADALIKSLIEIQPDLRGFAALYGSFLKDKKSEELLRLLTKVAERLRRDEAIAAQIDALIADPAYTEKVLDTGLAMLNAAPPRLDERMGWAVLRKIATVAKKPEKIVELCRWRAKHDPSPPASRELILALIVTKRYDEAEAEYESMMGRFPEERNPQTMLDLARLRIEAHREEAAIPLLRDVLKQAPNDPGTLFALATALARKGKLDEGVVLIKDALKNDPANTDLIRVLMMVYMQDGKNQEMIDFLKTVVDRFPNNDEVVRLARSNLSIAYTNLGDYAKGEAELELLFAKNPEDPGVNNDLGYLYAEQGKNLEKAEQMIRKAVADEPENSAYLDSLGWVLFKRGKAKEAVDPLKKAIEHLERDDATIPEHLGDVYFEIRDRAKAKEYWDKAEKVAAGMTPPDKRLPEIRKKLESLKKLESSPSPASGANP